MACESQKCNKNIVNMNNDVVIYQSSDGLVKMEAIVDTSNETIWATQKAMAELFGVTVPNISYHFKRIFASGELDAQTVIKEILITAQSGVRGVSEEKIRYYNLDAILSLGYRVNSVQATAFRKWATSTNRSRTRTWSAPSPATKKVAAPSPATAKSTRI